MGLLLRSLLFLLILLHGSANVHGQPPGIKFLNCDAYYFATADRNYSWYGECKDGLAEGFGILSRDTIIPGYNKPINLYQTALFEKGVQLPKSTLVDQNRYIEKMYDRKEELNNNNYGFYITYETKDIIYTVYRTGFSFGRRHNPVKVLSIFDKATESTRMYVGVYSSPNGSVFYYNFQVWNKGVDTEWSKTTLENCGYPPEECEFTQSLREMFSRALAAGDPSAFYILSSEICLNVMEVRIAIENAYEKSLGLFYPEFIDTAGKICLSEKVRDFFVERCDNVWKGVPFLRNAVDANFSRCKNEQNLKMAAEYGLSIRYTFKKDVIGKRYVPVLEKRYTATLDEFYINDQKVEVTQREVSKSGGYSETRYGYIGIYQLVNESKDYLLIPLTLKGEARFSENTIEDKGFFFVREERDVKWVYRPFRVDKTFLLGPGELVKEQLETGEEIPSNFRVEFGDIQKVDLSWVTKLDKALKGDLTALNEMLSDEKAKPWKKEMMESSEAAFMKTYSQLINLTIKPSDELLYDPDFESEVKAVITNRSAKKLSITVETSFGKTSTVVVEPSKSETLTYMVKGKTKESLKISLKSVKPVS